jgi:hypothetical protein
MLFFGYPPNGGRCLTSVIFGPQIAKAVEGPLNVQAARLLENSTGLGPGDLRTLVAARSVFRLGMNAMAGIMLQVM